MPCAYTAHAILIINNTQQVYNSTNRKSKATAKEMANYRISTYVVLLKNSQGSSNGSVGGEGMVQITDSLKEHHVDHADIELFHLLR